MPSSQTARHMGWRVITMDPRSPGNRSYGPRHASKDEALREACRRLEGDAPFLGVEGPAGELIGRQEIVLFCTAPHRPSTAPGLSARRHRTMAIKEDQPRKAHRR